MSVESKIDLCEIDNRYGGEGPDDVDSLPRKKIPSDDGNPMVINRAVPADISRMLPRPLPLRMRLRGEEGLRSLFESPHKRFNA